MAVASKGDQDEILSLRTTITALDREKDALQAVVDEKTEKVVQLEEALRAKDRSTQDLKLNLEELEAAVE